MLIFVIWALNSMPKNLQNMGM